MPLSWLDHFGSIASILGLLIGLPAVLAAFYQAQKARQEARQVREGSMHSRDCLEFIVGDGTTVNVVPLETLNWLPREGDLILLPGDGVGNETEFVPAAYLVESALLRAGNTQEAAPARGQAHESCLYGDYIEPDIYRTERRHD